MCCSFDSIPLVYLLTPIGLTLSLGLIVYIYSKLSERRGRKVLASMKCIVCFKSGTLQIDEAATNSARKAMQEAQKSNIRLRLGPPKLFIECKHCGEKFDFYLNSHELEIQPKIEGMDWNIGKRSAFDAFLAAVPDVDPLPDDVLS